MEDVVILSGVRTAIGAFGGSLADTPASDLAAKVMAEAVSRAGIEPGQVDQVILGCVGQVAEDGYISRYASVKAGMPVETPAYTVNRICGSGLEAINTAARWLQTGDAEIIVAGGAENMSAMPFYLRKARYGYKYGHDQLEDGTMHLLTDPFDRILMGETAENLAERYEVSREVQDEYSIQSQERARVAIDEGRFTDQILPIEVRKGRETVMFDTDEHPRSTTMEALAKLRTIFREGGSVTAGNASGINDGAAAVVVTTAVKAEELGLTPKMRMVARAESGVEPSIMGSGPIPAVEKVLEKAGLTVDDLDTIELNEAFA
ncbi:MAG: acetyl-CoA C-acyltransferase, partial [Dehalococcoidia bacterium]